MKTLHDKCIEIVLLRRLFCRHSGGVSFVRNIYGDEIILANARSIWRCKRCGGCVYMPGLGGGGAAMTNAQENGK